MTVFIYGLWDPRDGRLRYIGKTVNLKARFRRHLIDYDHGKITHCSTWVKGILADGYKPLLEVLEETTESAWPDAEREWIDQARQLGLDLVNMVAGGRGGHTSGCSLSAETRAKISASLKGRDAYWVRGKKKTTAQKLAISRANKGRKPRLGMRNKPETNAKIGKANAIALKGRKLPAETVLEGSRARWSKPGERERWAAVTDQRERDSKGRFLPQNEN